jgi:hypothetical protein
MKWLLIITILETGLVQQGLEFDSRETCEKESTRILERSVKEAEYRVALLKQGVRMYQLPPSRTQMPRCVQK